jgi:phosphoglycerate dehydrogenase-like enzyme
MKPTTAIIVVRKFAEKFFSDYDLDRLRTHVDLHVHYFEELDESGLCELVPGMDSVITSWETPAFTPPVLAAAPDLKIIAHAGGSVKPIVSDEVWARGIIVTSAAAALGIGVAETTLCMILLAGKRIPWLHQEVRNGGWHKPEIMDHITEMFRATIGIIGAGCVGQHLIKLLKCFDCSTLLFDPYKSEQEAQALGVEKVELDDLLQRSNFIAVCAPLTDETRGMLGKKQLELIQNHAVVINTARGALFNEPELIAELQKGRFMACLDVTEQEPPAAENPLRTLDNVILTPHIAGACANNLLRVGAMATDEIIRYFSGTDNKYPITNDMLATIG